MSARYLAWLSAGLVLWAFFVARRGLEVPRPNGYTVGGFRGVQRRLSEDDQNVNLSEYDQNISSTDTSSTDTGTSRTTTSATATTTTSEDVFSFDPLMTDVQVFLEDGRNVSSYILEDDQNVSNYWISGLYAGLELTKVTLDINGSDYEFDRTTALMRVVRASVNTDGAQSGQCAQDDLVNSAHIAEVGGDWASAGAQVYLDPTSLTEQRADVFNLTFKMGGEYRLCYSHEGDFFGNDTDVLSPRLVVAGLYDNRSKCALDEACLTKRPYRCYLLRGAYGNMDDNDWNLSSCAVDFGYTGAGYEGELGRGSWSEAFAVTYDDDGLVANVTPRLCAAADEQPADFLCMSRGSCFSGASSVQADEDRFTLPVGRNDLRNDGFRARTVAACYCPGGYAAGADGGACSDHTLFVQQVGVLHFYVSKVCLSGARAALCEPDFTGVSPQHAFSIRVECPTDACGATGASRLKLAMQKGANDLPSWASGSGCGSSVHGVYEWSDGQSTLMFPPSLNPDIATLNGGDRQDHKLWNYESGFLFVTGSSSHEMRSGTSGYMWDVCYCDGTCGVERNWFKVGQFRFAPFQLVSMGNDNSSAQEEFLVEYAMQPGVIGFYRPPEDYGAMALQRNGVIKLVSDQTLEADDAFCTSAEYDTDLLDGLTSWEVAKASFAGTRSRDGQRLIFNSGDTANQVTVKRAGYIAICYCALIDEQGTNATGDCMDDHWVFTQHITVRGPDTGQTWEVSTHVTFRLEYTGWGLSADDKIRIIPASGDCSGDPSGTADETAMYLECPYPCIPVGDVDSSVNGDITVLLLADNAYNCDNTNNNCYNNDIIGITVLDDHTTEVEFETSHTLSDGDHLQIGSIDDNIVCSPDDPEYICNAERLGVLKGQYRLVDRDTNDMNAPDSYIAGHAITTTSDTSKVTIQVGWPDPKPTFEVNYYSGKRGTWIRHNKAITAEEIMGTEEKLNMKVCWKNAERSQTFPTEYIAQVGTISLIDSHELADSQVSLTTTVQGQISPYAPLIISFRTDDEQAGVRYGRVQGMTRLRVTFFQTVMLEPRFIDGLSIDDFAGEDELSEAKQYICGKLFKEMWSSDAEFGFPMPRGCYYQVYGDTREINILFDTRNGLRAGYDYQLVLIGVVQQGAVMGGEYVEILTMDDTDETPYLAIERGLASLNKDAQIGAFGDSGVMFSSEGLTVLGGSDAGLIELSQGDTFSVELRGDTTGGGITASSKLRMFMWPLTQWDMDSTCMVSCEAYDDDDAPCGTPQSCKGLATVTNFQRNYLEVTLPAFMTTMDETISHTLHFSGLKFPKGGFFSSRLGAEISKSDDTRPHYIESAGPFLYKPPDEGQMVGRLVHYFGDGNEKPFAGDVQNILYANIVLAATLYSASQTGDAQMKITLPVGYVCLQPEDVDGQSGWMTQENLGVFGGQTPQGIGAPDNRDAATRGWTVSENTCTYKLRQNSIIFAGTSLMLRITVDNPPDALQLDNDTNDWQVTLSSKGHGTETVEFSAASFATAETSYSKSVAVLGHVTDASLVPTNFAVTPDTFQPSEGHLRFFFRAQQSTGVFSRLHLHAPESFQFSDCEAQDLEDSYYATGNGGRTRRLPGIISCTYYAEPYSYVEVSLEGEVLAGERYAFSISAVNPGSASSGQFNGTFQLFTLSSEGYHIDGTQETITFVDPHVVNLDWGGSVAESFSMYRTRLNSPLVTCAGVNISSMLPYSFSGERAMVTISPLCVPEVVNTTLRIIAPHGFIWDFGDSNFSGNLPGGVPQREGNVLLWPTPVVYDSRAFTMYYFQAMLQVPDASPTGTVNDFIFEFGYDAPTIDGRVSAAAVPAPLVRSLVNVALDYESNLAGAETKLIFQIQTITDIPTGGNISITGPEGFQFLTGCLLEPAPGARGSPYDADPLADSQMPPPDSACSSEVKVPPPGATASDEGSVEIMIMAGPTGITAGLYRFQLAAVNPAPGLPSKDTTTDCGYSCCWGFASRDAQGSPLDAPLSIPCFAVNQQMGGGGMPALTDQQRLNSGRDDRPGMYNPVVLSVSPSADSKYAGVMRVRGPEGVVFREDCLLDVETNSTTIFGEGTALDEDQYAAWPTDVEVTSCRGEGPDAYLYIAPVLEGASGLLAGFNYPFRLAIYQNPEAPPFVNQWSIEYSMESSIPFEGFDLWTFGGTSLLAVSSARSVALVDTGRFENPVTMTFNPQNTLVGPGVKIVVTAPEFFEFAHTDYLCTTLIQPVAEDATQIWGADETDCEVHALMLRMLTVTVQADRTLNAGTDYQITVFVHNPAIESPTVDGLPVTGAWTIQAHQSEAMSGVLPTFRDLVTIPGYVVHERASRWTCSDTTSTKGNEPVLGLHFEVKFPSSLEPGDKISVQAPMGFILEALGGNGQCNGFAWEGECNGQCNSTVSCNGTEMAILLQEHVSEEKLLQFILSTTNPPETPHVMKNNWIVSHLGPDAQIKATDALRSWDAVPQLIDVDIALVGQNKAAGQLSSISVSFQPMFAADELVIRTLAPAGTSFADATVTSTGHEVISKNQTVIRVRADIVVGIRTLVVIDQMRLGVPGGQTVFDLVTKLSNGDQVDEAMGFNSGFVQPGLLEVKRQMIQNGQAQSVPSLWEPRMLETSLAMFVFASTMDIQAGSTLVFSSESELSAQYQLFAQDFAVARVNEGVSHGHSASISGSTLTATLDEPLLAGTDYEVRITVRTPALASASASRWRVEAYSDYGLPGQRLRNTNDAMTSAFQLVDHVLLEVRSPDCPPTAIVAAQMTMDFQSTNPTEIFVVAPSGFNFTEDCLEQGGLNGEIVACTQAADIMGRAAARLTSNSDGVSGLVSGINVRVTVPVSDSVRAAGPSWYVSVQGSDGEQQGWGNDSVGFEVIPMQGFTVVYSGVPDISGLMVVGFIVHTQIPAGGRIQLGFPLGFVVQCEGAFFEQLGLTGDFVCTIGTGILELQISDPIPVGQHAFAVTSTPPNAVNGDNSFFIRIISPELQVLDAAMEADGLQIQKGLPMTALDLAWSNSEPEEKSTVSLGFELVSELPAQNPPQLGELVVELPPSFELTVTGPDEVEWTDMSLPHAESPWLDTTQPDRLGILLDEAACENLDIGAYRVAFPVRVPVQVPTYNVFVVTLCSPPSSNLSSRCTGWNDGRALVSFPISGFELGEVHPTALQAGTTDGAFRGASPGVAPLALAAGLRALAR